MTPLRSLSFALLAAGMLAAAPARAGWTLQANGTGQEAGFFQLSAFDAQHAMAVGTHQDPSTGNKTGVVAVTTNGQTWTQTTPTAGAPTIVPMYTAVRMVSAQKVFVGSIGKLLVSSNGGGAWTAYTETDWGPLKGPTIMGVSFADSLTGVLVGTAGTIRKTTDGGTTWTPVTSPVADAPWGGALMRDSTHLWVWGGKAVTDMDTGEVTGYENAALARSTDGGATFDVVFQGQARLIVRVFMINNSEGYLISNSKSGPTLEHTTDGGATWTTMGIPGGAAVVDTLNDIFFFDLCEGLVFAEQQENSIVGYTTDRGATWTALPLDGIKVPMPAPLPAVPPRLITMDFPSRDLGFVGGGLEALATYTPDSPGPNCGTGVGDGGAGGRGDGGRGAGGDDGGCGCRAAGASPSAALLLAALALARRRRRS
jgi:MYXO-CTERM domain-containing protein